MNEDNIGEGSNISESNKSSPVNLLSPKLFSESPYLEHIIRRSGRWPCKWSLLARTADPLVSPSIGHNQSLNQAKTIAGEGGSFGKYNSSIDDDLGTNTGGLIHGQMAAKVGGDLGGNGGGDLGCGSLHLGL